jgi:hypothetical protein
MVRKLLVWKTNKDTDGEFPPYMVYWMDYSPNRADPLKREPKPASTEEKAMEMADGLIASNIKKGWAKVDE